MSNNYGIYKDNIRIKSCGSKESAQEELRRIYDELNSKEDPWLRWIYEDHEFLDDHTNASYRIGVR